MINRNTMLEQIRSHIDKDGHHIYLVLGGPLPIFGYTIGVSEDKGFELIFAGGAFYSATEISEIINTVVASLRSKPSLKKLKIEHESLG